MPSIARLFKLACAALCVSLVSGSLTLTSKLVPEDPDLPDDAAGFGYALAVRGDTLVVGAPPYGPTYTGDYQGSAYVFTKDDTVPEGWSQQAKLIVSGGPSDENFGFSVAISDDTIVVGAFGDDYGDYGTTTGSAYVFTKDDTGWKEKTRLAASDGEPGDQFGISVAVWGDTIVVGACRADDRALSPRFWQAGSAYLFTRDAAGDWTEQARLTANDPSRRAFFGMSVAISSDTIVAGAHGDEGVRGALYVFSRDEGDNWNETPTKLTASDGDSWDYLGVRVAISGDIIVAGAHGDENVGGVTGMGSAYVFNKNAIGGWSEQTKLTASDVAVGTTDHFGLGVAVSGGTIIVAAPVGNKMYMFSKDATVVGGWGGETRITPFEAAKFGGSPAVFRILPALTPLLSEHKGPQTTPTVLYTLHPSVVQKPHFPLTWRDFQQILSSSLEVLPLPRNFTAWVTLLSQSVCLNPNVSRSRCTIRRRRRLYHATVPVVHAMLRIMSLWRHSSWTSAMSQIPPT